MRSQFSDNYQFRKFRIFPDYFVQNSLKHKVIVRLDTCKREKYIYTLA